MRDIISKVVYGCAWLAAVLTVLATVCWVMIIGNGNDCWASFAFTFGIAIPLGIGILLLVIVPGSVLYLQKKQHRDWMSLYIAGVSLFIVVGEAVLVFFVIHQRGE